MSQSLRHFAFALIGVGVLILLTYLIPPLRFIWPYFRSLDPAMQLGIGALFFGIVFLIVSLVTERIADRDYNRSLRDDQ